MPAEGSESLVKSEWQSTLLAVTERARSAAQEGRWDTVQECYERREHLLRARDPDPELAGQLLVIDGAVQEHAKSAQAAVSAALSELSSIRRNLSHVNDLVHCGTAPTQRIRHKA